MKILKQICVIINNRKKRLFSYCVGWYVTRTKRISQLQQSKPKGHGERCILSFFQKWRSEGLETNKGRIKAKECCNGTTTWLLSNALLSSWYQSGITLSPPCEKLNSFNMRPKNISLILNCKWLWTTYSELLMMYK